MTTQKAIVIKGPRDAQLVTDRPLPRLRDDYILIKTAAVALNPSDWKHVDFMPEPGALCGLDYSGTVVKIGSKVRKPFREGDRVFGFCHGANKLEHEDGAFAEYIVAKGDIQMKIPPRMTFEEAATLGAGITTVGQSMYQSLKLPLPSDAPTKEQSFSLLIYGGSTASGTLAIQFAKLSGLKVLTTCSPRNNDLVKQRGADAVWDYKDPECGHKINAYTSDSLNYALDCISEGVSPQICADALSTATDTTKTYGSLLRVPDFPRKDVQKKYTLGYTAIGEEMSYPGDGSVIPTYFPPREEDLKFMEMFSSIAEGLLAEGKFETHPLSVREGGLNGVLSGLNDMREGRVSGEKLVYRVADTT